MGRYSKDTWAPIYFNKVKKAWKVWELFKYMWAKFSVVEVRSLMHSDYRKVMSLVQTLPQNHKINFIFECEGNQYNIFLVILEVRHSTSYSFIFKL